MFSSDEVQPGGMEAFGRGTSVASQMASYSLYSTLLFYQGPYWNRVPFGMQIVCRVMAVVKNKVGVYDAAMHVLPQVLILYDSLSEEAEGSQNVLYGCQWCGKWYQ